MKLGTLRRKDITRCVELEKRLFVGDDPWSARAFHSELDAGNYYLSAYDEDVLIGYAGLAVVGRPGDFEASVHTVGVDPAYQGQGIGTALLRGLLTRADELNAPVFLEVRTDNDRAVGLYERHGFTRIGLRKGYYQPSGADAYTMKREARAGQEVS
ncbi:ribosomal protein S18-alanine N-acetyltransferase [Amycolatopsis taiwanensis]|uniref:ribosomal protein S18-alanine N-acetyltransferase n=1 Tax=Amycolatopsis taiwanensis TaxID=342230 RepID=UPI000480A889|nr:ribosomal protein S18-alanine N-acetyltransferase [Amycolatopsis taiwanensis]